MNSPYPILFSLLLLSCVEQKNELPTYDIRENATEHANISEIADTVIPIPLETKDECLLWNHFTIQRDDSLLFIDNDGTIYLFGTNGKFHKQLTHKGNGPGESRVYGFDLDREKKELIVNGHGRKIIRYKYDGTLVSETPSTQSVFRFSLFSFYQHSIWTIGTQDTDNSNWVLRLDAECRIRDSIYLCTPQMPRIMYTSFFYDSFSAIDDQLYINYPSNYTDYLTRDTLYRIDGKALHPVLRVNYGDYTYRAATDPFKSGYPVQPHHIRMNKRFLFTGYNYDNESLRKYENYVFCYDFSTGKKYHLKDGFDDDLFHTGKADLQPMDINHTEFYYIKSAETLLGTSLERDESDNPVVFIVKLKE